LTKIAYVKDNKFWPIEVKWTTQIRPKDLKKLANIKMARFIVKLSTAGKS